MNSTPFVSRKLGVNCFVGSVRGDKSFLPLELCVVSENKECGPYHQAPNCIFENLDYRFRLNGCGKRYLRNDDGYFRIVAGFNDVSPLSLLDDDR